MKLLKGEHPTKKWQNCGTEVLCVMLFYDGADLTRIVNKVLGKTVLSWFNSLDTYIWKGFKLPVYS